MGTLLLRDPWLHFYLLYLGGLLVVLIWDCWCNPRATQESAQSRLNDAAQGRASPPPRSQELWSVLRPGQRTDKEVGPNAWRLTGGALHARVAAPTSRKRREDRVVAP
jgi:hypothetical protein